MSAARIAAILAKDLRGGPRSGVVLWAIVMPVVLTFLVQGVFGGLFESTPRLGLVDADASAVAVTLRATEGLDVRDVEDEATLRRLVEAHDLDGGLLLQDGFDAAVRARERPPLSLIFSGESAASERAVLSVTTLDAIRALETRRSPVTVEVVARGETDDLTTTQRIVPFLVLMALILAGMFVTSFSLVEERERGTLTAMLVTPARLGEVLAAKGLLGLFLAVAMATVTLALNDALAGTSPALAAGLAVGAAMSVQFGLIFGALARDVKVLYTLFKSVNILLVGPVVFYLFPDALPGAPPWIAKAFPTYWFLDPILEASMRGATLAQVGGDLLVGAAICVALVPVIAVLARRAARRIAAG